MPKQPEGKARHVIQWSLLSIAVLTSCSTSSSSTLANTPPLVPSAVVTRYDAQPKMEIQAIHLALGTPLQLSGELAGTIELTSYVTEQIEVNPANPESYPAGSGVVMALTVEGTPVELSDLSKGYESQAIAWTDSYKVTLLAHDSSASSVDLQVQKISDESAVAAGPSQRIERGASLVFGEQLSMKFMGHGHKSVYEGQTSPLMVNLEFRRAEQQLLEVTHHVYPPETTTWRFQDFEFNMLQHEYDRYMSVKVRRLVLQTVSAQ